MRFIGSLDGWLPEAEVTFADYGERGSIDLLATHRRALAAFVGEIKSVIASLEETNRTLDMKARLAAKVVFKRQGWRPQVVAKVLIVPRDMSIRRVIDDHAATMRSIYPADSRQVRAWLRHPDGQLAGIWYVSHGPNPSMIRR